MIWGILFTSLFVRLININQSLWLDEGTSAIVARDLGFSEILTRFSTGDFHPPFYYLFLKVWSNVFGTSELALRSLSVLAGVGTVYLVYLIAKKISNERSGILAATFLALSGLHIYYSQEARMYSLATFFVTLSVYFFIKAVKERKVVNWVLFSLTLPLISMTDYLPLLILPVFWIFGVIAKKSISWWKSFVLSHIPLITAWLWWLPTFQEQLGGGLRVETVNPVWWKVLGGTTLKQILLIPTKFMFGRISFYNKTLYGALTVVVGLFFFYLFLKTLREIKKTKIAWLWLVLPIAVSALIGFKIPAFSYFRLIFTLPAFYLLLAIGATKLKKKQVVVAIFIVVSVNLLSSLAYLTNSRFQREDWKGLVTFIESRSKEKESITLFVADAQMEAYRYYQKDVKIAGPMGLSSDYDQIWLMRYVKEIFDPEDNLRHGVEELGFLETGQYDFNGVVVWRYEK